MIFQELLTAIRKHPLQELRAHTDNYFEAVVSMSKLVDVENLLVSYFGVPLKPAGLNPSSEARRFSKPYGGIRQHQTMYFRKKEGGNEVAFLWPWGCQTLVTVKVILEAKPQTGKPEGDGEAPKSLWKTIFGRWL